MYHTPPLGGTDGEPEPREKHECPIGNPDSQHSEVIQKLLQEVWNASAKAERKRFKQRVDALTVIGDEEMMEVRRQVPAEDRGDIDGLSRRYIKAQLQDCKDKLKEMME